jgi:DNA polymerase III subunit beta
MDLTAKKSDLASALAHAAGIAKPKSPMPILACALLTANVGRLRVHATDMNVEVDVDVTAAIADAGTVAVKAADLLDRVKLMPEGPVRLTLSGERMQVRAQGTKQKHEVKTLSGADYPASPTIEGKRIAIDSKSLVRLIDRVAFAACRDTGVTTRNMVMIQSNGHTLASYAAETFWIAKQEIQLSAPEVTIALPLVCAEAIVRTFANVDVRLDLILSENAIAIVSERLRFAAALSAMAPPPFEMVLRGQMDTSRFSVTVMRKRLSELVKSAGMADANVDIEIAGDDLNAKSESSDGVSSDSMECENEDGGSGKIRLVGAQLQTILGKIPDDRVTLGIGDPKSPLVVRGDGFVCVNGAVVT